MSDDEIKKLEEKIAGFYSKTGTEIIIIIEDSNKSHSRKFHTPCLIAQKWQIGEPEKCDDILIVVSRRRTYVDLNYGLEINNKLSAENRRNALYQNILPAFRKQKYYEGLAMGIDYIIEKIPPTSE